jgi:MOSC domain-containing protein YiiM
VFRLGEARLQVCQPRNPCWKIDARFGIEGMAAFIAENHLTGWYFRVVQTGTVNPDDTLESVDPADHAPSLAAAMLLWHSHRPTPQALHELAATPGIASGWQKKICERADWLASHLGQSSPPPVAFHVKPDH